MIVSYNWLEIICERDSIPSLSSLKLIESKKFSISSAESDLALNAPVITLFVFFCIV